MPASGEGGDEPCGGQAADAKQSELEGGAADNMGGAVEEGKKEGGEAAAGVLLSRARDSRDITCLPRTREETR